MRVFFMCKTWHISEKSSISYCGPRSESILDGTSNLAKTSSTIISETVAAYMFGIKKLSIHLAKQSEITRMYQLPCSVTGSNVTSLAPSFSFEDSSFLHIFAIGNISFSVSLQTWSVVCLSYTGQSLGHS